MQPFDFGIGRTIPPQYGNLDTRLHIPDRGDMPSAGPHHRKTHLQHTLGIARSYPVAEPRQLLSLRLQQLRTAQSQNTLHRIEILRTGSQVVTRRLRKPNVQVAQIRQATVNDLSGQPYQVTVQSPQLQLLIMHPVGGSHFQRHGRLA